MKEERSSQAYNPDELTKPEETIASGASLSNPVTDIVGIVAGTTSSSVHRIMRMASCFGTHTTAHLKNNEALKYEKEC